MSNKYPKIGECSVKSKYKGKCYICDGIKSEMRVDIQVNCFRGDDVVISVHKECLKNGGYNKIIQKYKGLLLGVPEN